MALTNIRNIVFDLGMILTGLDKERCIRAFRLVGLDDVAYYVEEHRTEDFFSDVEIGRTDTAGFCSAIRQRTGCKSSDAQIVWAWNELLTGIPATKLDMLIRLKERGFRLFILSNTNDMHWQKCVSDFLPYNGYAATDYFEQVFLSYRMHMAKPEAEIYETMLRQGNMVAEETLFIDDNHDNIAAAKQLGINVILDPDGTKWTELLR